MKIYILIRHGILGAQVLLNSIRWVRLCGWSYLHSRNGYWASGRSVQGQGQGQGRGEGEGKGKGAGGGGGGGGGWLGALIVPLSADKVAGPPPMLAIRLEPDTEVPAKSGDRFSSTTVKFCRVRSRNQDGRQILPVGLDGVMAVKRQ